MSQAAFTVQCPSCSAGFLIDPNKVPEDGVHARCSACSDVFLVERPESGAATEAPPVEAPAASPGDGFAPAPEAPSAPAEPAVEAQSPDVAEPSTPTEAPAAPPQFGRQDPHDKASRLARVLVSDMISYNPDRYATALEKDSLKEDFEDEVQKSWEEYVEQVGQELADSSSYFQDALNEILARGKKVF